MKKHTLTRRLRRPFVEEASKAAEAVGVSLTRLVNVAVAEKISALRTDEYFAERAARGDTKKALQVLERAGRQGKPVSPKILRRPTT